MSHQRAAALTEGDYASARVCAGTTKAGTACRRKPTKVSGRYCGDHGGAACRRCHERTVMEHATRYGRRWTQLCSRCHQAREAAEAYEEEAVRRANAWLKEALQARGLGFFASRCCVVATGFVADPFDDGYRG